MVVCWLLVASLCVPLVTAACGALVASACKWECRRSTSTALLPAVCNLKCFKCDFKAATVRADN